jgi:hypothetical protein
MSGFSIASAQLPAGEAPVFGVPLEPYVKCRTNNDVVHHFVEEEVLDASTNDSGTGFAVRYRWLRSPDAAENGRGHVCHIHPDRPAAYCSGFWRSEYGNYGYPFSHACHCSLECFKQHWRMQLEYYQRAQEAKEQNAEGATISVRHAG